LIIHHGVTEVTRDHVMRSDASQLVPMPEHAATVPTRWLGGTCVAPPESYAWRVHARYSVAVCSSELHQHRSSPQQEDDLRTWFELRPFAEGLGVWIDR
jgi:hypothetical protein